LTGFYEETGFMARIPEAEIERLKREISLERLVESAGVVLTRHGADLHGLCPFHDDKGPSLVVSPAKNLWHCLGACQTGGSVIDWVMKAQGVSFRHAVELLREGLPLAAGARPVKETTVRQLPPPVAPDADDQRLLNQVIGYYHETLKRTPAALDYLKARGLDQPQAIERFRLGFADRSLGLRLPEKNRKTGAAMRAQLQKLGLMRESGHEHFNGSLVVPVCDEGGNVTEVYGRKITRALRAGTPDHLYLPGPHRGVWNVEALAASREVILCEALIDALTFWCAGFRNVTAAYGVEGFTDDHLAAFARHGTERVLIAYDRDEAGERAAEKLAERLIGAGIEAWRIQFPKGMDANEYALKVAPAAKSLGLAIRKAMWLGKAEAPSREAPARKGRPAAILQPIAEAVADSSLAADEAAKVKIPEPIPAAEPLPASPMPMPAAEIACEIDADKIVFAFGEGADARRYRVRGLAENTSYKILKVNVLAERGNAFYVDTLDLLLTRSRVAYVIQAAVELALAPEIVKEDLARLYRKLEALRDAAIEAALAPKKPEAVAMASLEREAALSLLRAPDLVERIVEDLTRCGLVGERTNKLVAYLAATSRKLDAPLAILVQSSSAAGKSALMDAVLALMPEEDRVKYSAMTGQALYYLANGDLKHKILAIAEEEGAARAAYALKLLQSEGRLTIASTGKDPVTGNLVTQDYTVEGPTMLFTTTTAVEVDPELHNRCLVLGVDESREQTQAIHRLQRDRRTLEGLARRARRGDVQRLHQNAQRLLRPLAVLNPYAQALTFPDQATRMRRDHEKYLTLIDTVALLHQMQREVKATVRDGQRIEYIEATADDVALANTLAHEVLGRSLDELPPQTRRLLLLLDGFVVERARTQGIARAQLRFSRRSVREAIGWGDTQLKVHLARLADLEYVIAYSRGPATEYELVYDGGGEDGRPFVPGLIEVAALCATATTADRVGANPDRSGANADRSALSRGAVGPRSGGGRDARSAAQPIGACVSRQLTSETAKTHSKDGNGKDPSYTQGAVIPLAAVRG